MYITQRSNDMNVINNIFIIIIFCKYENALESVGFLTLWNNYRSLKLYHNPTTYRKVVFQLLFLAHMSNSDKVSFSDHILSAVRRAFVRPSVRP